MSILHILNGDATAHSFAQTGLSGDVLVWREVLSEGPLAEDISSAAFWDARSEWICKNFIEAPAHYFESIVRPLEKLSEPYDEINLWFDFDLHCQANMLGVMAILTKRTDLSLPVISLVCPDEVPGVEHFRGMGQLNSSQLEDLYDDRQRLNEYEFILAAEAWKLYVSGNAAALEKWLDQTTFWGNLSLLQPALQAHLRRIKINENGLNGIEQKLLDIWQSGSRSRHSIYQGFWQTEKIYGMGDMEINLYLAALIDKQLIDRAVMDT